MFFTARMQSIGWVLSFFPILSSWFPPQIHWKLVKVFPQHSLVHRDMRKTSTTNLTLLPTKKRIPRWNLNKVPISSYIILMMEEILHQLGCIKPCKYWDKLHINWCRISSINSRFPLYIVFPKKDKAASTFKKFRLAFHHSLWRTHSPRRLQTMVPGWTCHGKMKDTSMTKNSANG